MLGFASRGTPASALGSPEAFKNLRNVVSRLCVDIRAQDPPAGARARLWPCAQPAVPGQLFRFLPSGEGDPIQVKGSPMCLQAGSTVRPVVTEQPCDSSLLSQSWLSTRTGEIVNAGTGQCLDTRPANETDADVVTARCNGMVSQRWFFSVP
jgi:hypothetical protein